MVEKAEIQNKERKQSLERPGTVQESEKICRENPVLQSFKETDELLPTPPGPQADMENVMNM